MTAAVKMPPEFTDPERSRGPQDVPNNLFGVTWDSDEDPQNPRNWSELQKWATVTLVATIAFIPPFASSIIAPPINLVMNEFHSTSYVQSTLVVSIFMLGFAAGPLVISPLSEEYGRNIVFISTVILHLVFTIACALSTSINMLIVFRFIAGCFGSAPITIGGGTITDIMPQGKRGKAMAIFIMGPTLGPSFGPVIGGYLAQAAGWRWLFWLLAITLGVMMAFTLICLKETYAPKILAQKARNLRKETGNQRWRSKLQIDLSARQLLLRAIVRPSKLLVLSPIVLSLSIYMATSYGYLFLLFTTFPTVFQDHYRFSIGTIGLVYIAIGVGLAAGQVILFYTSDRLMAQHEIECGERIPEYRLRQMLWASPFLAGGLLWYGWSADKNTHWIVPILGTVPVGLGIIFIFTPLSTYLLDAYPAYSASAVAASTVLRSLFSAILPLAGPPMYNRLGLGWGNSLLAFIALALGGVPLLFCRYGKRWRERANLVL